MRSRETVRFSDVAAAELRKAFTGWTWAYTLLLGLGMSALAVLGAASEAEAQLNAGVPVVDVTAGTLRFWFMTLLGSSVFGAVFVTREYSNGSIVRSALLAGTRRRLFAAKVAVTAVVGLLFAAVTVAAALASVPLLPDAEWGREVTLTLVGVAVVVAVAAPWGAVFGWLLRSSVAAVGVLLMFTLVVDEGLFRLAPSVGRFTMQIAMGSVFRDGKPEALAVEWAVVVMLTWLLGGLAVAAALMRRRDLP